MSAINYDLTKIKGVVLDIDGVLSASTVPMNENGEPQRTVNVKDGYALQYAVKTGLKIAIISGGYAQAHELRYKKLGIADLYQKIAHKLPVLRRWMEEEGLSGEEVAYMGDDIADLQCMREVGLPCAPYDAAHEAKETAVYVSPYTGGYGCVRDLIEQVLKAQGLWMREDIALTW